MQHDVSPEFTFITLQSGYKCEPNTLRYLESLWPNYHARF